MHCPDAKYLLAQMHWTHFTDTPANRVLQRIAAKAEQTQTCSSFFSIIHKSSELSNVVHDRCAWSSCNNWLRYW